MDLRRPLSVVTPTLDGDVLGLLATADLELSGREISRRVAASSEGVRGTLARLVEQGIVIRERANTRMHLYRLNRAHIAAPWISGLAALRLELIGKLREAVEGWQLRPVLALLFGSAARGDATSSSDLDLLVVRPENIDSEDPVWREQLVELETYAVQLTGNDARIAEYSESEVRRARGRENVVTTACREGIELFGSSNSLRPKRGGITIDEDQAVRSNDRSRQTQESGTILLRRRGGPSARGKRS